MDPVWEQTAEVEWLRATVVVDNVTDFLSEPPDCCEGEAPACSFSNERMRSVAAVRSGAAPCFDFRNKLHAAHGLSVLLTAQPAGGGRPHTLLFDAGPEGQVWRTNAGRLGVSAGEIEAVVLSHWHMDHSGGLPEVANMIAEYRQGASASTISASPLPPVVFDVHPQRPACRGALGPDGRPIPLNPDPQLAQLEVPGATEVQQHAEAHTLCDGCFYVSGHIPRQTTYEKGNPTNASQWEEGGPWQSDPDVIDERFLAVRVRGRGPVVLSACSHAGIVNVARAVQAAGGEAPYALIGGLHLSTADCQDRIAATAADLAEMKPALVVAGHCTGWRAQAALVDALPGRCMPGSVGSTYEFHGAGVGAEAAAH